MTSQLVLAVIFFLILSTFKSPPPQFLNGNVGRLASRDFQVADSIFPFKKKAKEKVFSVGPLEAKGVGVFDVTQNKLIFEINSEQALPLASITKLMTALLLEEKVDRNSYIKISGDAILQAGSEGMKEGDEYSGADLRDIMLSASSNDAAWAVAEFLSPEGINKFSNMMDVRARELNLNSLKFSNPHGLDFINGASFSPSAYGSARDISSLLKYIYENHPNMLEKTRAQSFVVKSKVGRNIELENTNQAIRDIPQIIGGKTGYTKTAGGNLVFIFDVGFNRPIIVTILGSTESGRFEDAKKIVAAALDYYKEDGSND